MLISWPTVVGAVVHIKRVHAQLPTPLCGDRAVFVSIEPWVLPELGTLKARTPDTNGPGRARRGPRISFGAEASAAPRVAERFSDMADFGTATYACHRICPLRSSCLRTCIEWVLVTGARTSVTVQARSALSRSALCQ